MRCCLAPLLFSVQPFSNALASNDPSLPAWSDSSRSQSGSVGLWGRSLNWMTCAFAACSPAGAAADVHIFSAPATAFGDCLFLTRGCGSLSALWLRRLRIFARSKRASVRDRSPGFANQLTLTFGAFDREPNSKSSAARPSVLDYWHAQPAASLLPSALAPALAS